MKRPFPLSAGDKVALIAPSSPVSEAVLERSAESVRFLGLSPVLFPCCRAAGGSMGKDAERASDVNNAFADKAIKGIFCLRGGYGATRILNRLDTAMIKKNPKVFVGYSDITALHLVLNSKCGFITFHGPMPAAGYTHISPFSLASLKKNLFSDSLSGEIKNPPGEKIETMVSGTAAGIITGGNLSILQSTLGSPFEVDTRDKLLLIEDVGERPYRLDRALTALALAGKFRDCAGIILGTFANCEARGTDASCPGWESLTIRQIIAEVVRPFNKPTVFNFRSGHVDPQITVPLGAFMRLDARENFIKINISDGSHI